MGAATMELSLLQEISAKLDSLTERLDRLEGQPGGANYPKRVMKKSELKKLGFTEEYLMAVFRKRNQKIAWKLSNAPNSVIYFDTVELEKFRKAQCAGER